MLNESKLTLVLLPGMDGTGDLFQNLLTELPQNLKTVIVRYPNTTVLSYAELAALVALQIPKNSPYFLLAESFSGPIAIALAARANEHLKGVVLSCTFAINPRPLLSKWSFLVPTMAVNSALLSVMSKLLMSHFKSEVVYEQLKIALSKSTPNTMRARLNAVISVNYLAELAKIKVPILYLKAKHDRVMPSNASEIIVKYAKNVSVVEIDAPHLLLQISAKKAALEILAFIKGVLKLKLYD